MGRRRGRTPSDFTSSRDRLNALRNRRAQGMRLRKELEKPRGSSTPLLDLAASKPESSASTLRAGIVLSTWMRQHASRMCAAKKDRKLETGPRGTGNPIPSLHWLLCARRQSVCRSGGSRFARMSGGGLWRPLPDVIVRTPLEWCSVQTDRSKSPMDVCVNLK